MSVNRLRTKVRIDDRPDSRMTAMTQDTFSRPNTAMMNQIPTTEWSILESHWSGAESVP
eukprot:gene18381-5877_t